MVATAIGCGRRDIEANNIEPVRLEITDDDRHFMSQRLGVPSATLAEGIHISQLQSAGTDHRYYNNRLLQVNSGQRAATSQRGRGVQTRETTPCPSVGRNQNQRSSTMGAAKNQRSSTSSGAKERLCVWENRVPIQTNQRFLG